MTVTNGTQGQTGQCVVRLHDVGDELLVREVICVTSSTAVFGLTAYHTGQDFRLMDLVHVLLVEHETKVTG